MTSLGLKHWTLLGMYKVKYSSMMDQFRTSRGGFQTISLAPSYDDVVKTYMCISAAPKCHQHNILRHLFFYSHRRPSLHYIYNQPILYIVFYTQYQLRLIHILYLYLTYIGRMSVFQGNQKTMLGRLQYAESLYSFKDGMCYTYTTSAVAQFSHNVLFPCLRVVSFYPFIYFTTRTFLDLLGCTLFRSPIPKCRQVI